MPRHTIRVDDAGNFFGAEGDSWDGRGLNQDNDLDYLQEAVETVAYGDVAIAAICDRRDTPLNGYWIAIIGDAENWGEDIIDGFEAFSLHEAKLLAKGYMRGFGSAYAAMAKGGNS